MWLSHNVTLSVVGSVAMVLLAGCVTDKQAAEPAPQSAVIEQIREVDLTPRFARGVGSAVPVFSDSGPRAATYNGDGSTGIKRSPQVNASEAGQDVTGAIPPRAQT